MHDEGELIAHPLADANAQDNTPNVDLKSLEQQLQKAKERDHILTAEFARRERWYQDQITSLTDTIKLLATMPSSRVAALEVK